MERLEKEAIAFFNEEVRQINIAQGGKLSHSYRDYLSKKKSYYQLATDEISKSYSRQKIIEQRLAAIDNGAKFGEEDVYSTDSYFQYRLIGVFCPFDGRILVEDLSVKPHKKLVTDVMSIYIEGID